MNDSEERGVERGVHDLFNTIGGVRGLSIKKQFRVLEESEYNNENGGGKSDSIPDPLDLEDGSQIEKLEKYVNKMKDLEKEFGEYGGGDSKLFKGKLGSIRMSKKSKEEEEKELDERLESFVEKELESELKYPLEEGISKSEMLIMKNKLQEERILLLQAKLKESNQKYQTLQKNFNALRNKTPEKKGGGIFALCGI